MMLSKVESRKKRGEDLGNEKLLRELEAINKAIYPDRSRSNRSISTLGSQSKSVGKTHISDSKSKPKQPNENPSNKDKKSFWNWKPLKALSHIRNRRFNCCFSLLVHSVEELPPSFDSIKLCVHWKRRDGGSATRPVRVSQRIAEFEEELTHVCSVYGSRNGPHHSAKYEAKHFLLYVSVFGAPDVDLGKHRVDLTRLLPLTLEELEEEKSSGKWTTSFKLSGKAKGAVMNVSFGYSVINDNPGRPAVGLNAPEMLKLKQNSTSPVKCGTKFTQGDNRSSMRRTGSLPVISGEKSPGLSRSVEDIKVLREVLPISRSELSSSVDYLYQTLDEDKLDTSIDNKSGLDVSTEHVEPLKPSSDSLLDSSQENATPEHDFTEHVEPLKPSSDSLLDSCQENAKPEHVFTEHVEPLKPSSDSLLDSGQENAKPEFDVFTELAEPLKHSLGSLPDSGKENVENDVDDNDFSVKEHGIELSLKESVKSDKDILEVAEVSLVETPDRVQNYSSFGAGPEEGSKLPSKDEEGGRFGDNLVICEYGSRDEVCTKESLLKELESALNVVSTLGSAGLDSPEDLENHVEVESNLKLNRIRKSHSLDDVTESVASEFLTMMGIEHSPFGMSSESEPDSPRERLLRQFEKDTLSSGFSLFDLGLSDGDQVQSGEEAASGPSWGNLYEDFELSSMIQAAGDEHCVATQSDSNKTRAKTLEDLETEALMREWGMNEKAFQHSPPNSSGGFGSPIDLPPEDPLQLPPLGDGLGPFVQTESGGFLRSMNPALFRSAKSGGSLVMQASRPVVVPADMGSGIMEILQRLASAGIEKLSMQANKLMPLEDVTGFTVQQMAWETATHLEAPERQALLQHESDGQDLSSGRKKVKGNSSLSRPTNDIKSSSRGHKMDSEYVSLEELAPLAMDKIEALSIEGLRIQSGMSDEDAPSNISSQSIGEISALEGKRGDISGSLGLEGAAGLQLLDIKDTGNEDDGMMSLSLTLDEWIRLDSGEIDDGDQISERTSKILAAHHANCRDLIRGGSKREKKRGKGSSRRCGLLGNNFTVALMVQLRDPLRNYEPVGTPMLALIQVERVFIPPKPKIYSTVSELRRNNDEDETELVANEDKKKKTKEENTGEEEGIPQFKITEVHVASLKTEPGKKKLWGTSTQQQSGSRWLLANGMGKSSKHPFMKSKAVTKSTAPAATTKVQSGDTLWSISARVHGKGGKCKELAALDPHIRNPNVIFPNETLRLS
ncbi:protein PLASTID MOVEMENT IMPAIRED 1-RELATED 1 [Malania oleifera]|uniref:protein PLASTID MOVEMENT IMPAIRED 1-RELATED 1 n=1 Tax=Malania oleifera TaxID=397392 RepID=UPI0025AE8AD3|nr:protein PLASTID MOVEMENT IMPAIRED 1-RELATED 1 [Malania oleifera]